MLSAGAGVAYQIFTNGTLNGSNLVFTVNGGTAAVDTYAAFLNGFQLQIFNYPLITTQPASQTNVAGSTVQFSVGASGGLLNYQWNFNGTALSGATGSALALTNVQTNAAGSYTVVVTNVAGSVTSAAATLTVTNPDITLSPSGGGGVTSSGFAFQCSIPVGCTYVILASSNLLNWTPISTNIALTGSAAFTDASATNCSKRFYRAMVR